MAYKKIKGWPVETEKMMLPRMRVLSALGHKCADRVPLGFAATSEVRQKLRRHFGLETDEAVFERLGIDIREVGPSYIGPPLQNYNGKEWEGEDDSKAFQDIWGVWRRPVSYSGGYYQEICWHPLAEAKTSSDLDRFGWPKVSWWDMRSIPAKIDTINEKSEYAILIGNGNIFETAWYMRGLDNMLIDLKVQPEFAYELMHRITDYKIEYLGALLGAGQSRIDLVFTADDIGTQTGLLMSLELWRKIIKPHHVRMNTTLKRFGAKILYHTDGAVTEAVSELIDMGIDVLSPLQFSAQGMDPWLLKEQYGDQLCFHGGIDVQTLLPKSTPEEIRKVVKNRIDVLGRNGGYILAPSHAIQIDAPVQNILSLYETARYYG